MFKGSLIDASLIFLLLSSLELSDTKVYQPQISALLGIASHFCVDQRFMLRGLEFLIPLPSQFGTHKTVTARFWPWLEPFLGKVVEPFAVVPFAWG